MRRRRPGPAPHLRLQRPEPLAGEPAALPDRYRIRKGTRGSEVYCVEAPTLHVRVERGFSVTAAAARGYPAGSIFLDGAAQGAPFIDTERDIYNLDHHEGCVRAFTLSTCEQAMVLVRRGLDLRKRDRVIYANDADLDTVLAIWILLNHLRLNDDPDTRAGIMPLVRLQGAIDAQGLALQDLCGLPTDLFAKTRAQMDHVRARELALKQAGRWEEINLARFVADQLRALDAIYYRHEQFRGVDEVEELARTEISDRSIAVVCRSRSGIYEVERELRRLHGDRLGVIVLQTGRSAYSVRQVDPSLPGTLERLYEDLNLIDPAAGGSRSSNRWGGSAEIGGSPRKSGTRVSPQKILAACRRAFGRTALRSQLRSVGRALGLASVGAALALAALPLPAFLGSRLRLPELAALPPGLAFGATLTALAGALLLLRGGRTPGRFGRRLPSGADWLLMLPLALVGGLAGGAWVAAPRADLGSAPTLAALALLPLACELLFRGLVHGTLVPRFRIQRSGGRWFVSLPVLLSAALCTAWQPLLLRLGIAVDVSVLGAPALAGGLLLGVATGVARERSESVLAPITLHWLALAALLAAPYLA
jgi:membrane protease YdiL (CAAX protease family)